MENDKIESSSEESDTIYKIIFISIFLAIMLAVVVIIIGALNSGNAQSGTVVSSSLSENLYNLDNSGQYLMVSSINGIKCTINSITVNGTLIPTSNYTINNCHVAYTP